LFFFAAAAATAQTPNPGPGNQRPVRRASPRAPRAGARDGAEEHEPGGATPRPSLRPWDE
jgi:hypothetical protein